MQYVKIFRNGAHLDRQQNPETTIHTSSQLMDVDGGHEHVSTISTPPSNPAEKRPSRAYPKFLIADIGKGFSFMAQRFSEQAAIPKRKYSLMNTQCTAAQLEFNGLGRHAVVCEFNGGKISSGSG